MLVKNSDVVVDSGSSAKHVPAQIRGPMQWPLAAIIHSESFLRPYFIPGDLGPFFQMHRTIKFETEPLPMREGGREIEWRRDMTWRCAPVRPILPANHFCDKFPQAESSPSPQNS